MIPLLWRRSAAARLTLAVIALALGGGAVLGIQLAAGALQQQSRTAAQEAAGAAQIDIMPFSRPGFSAAELAAVRRLAPVEEAQPLVEKADLAQLPSGGFRQVVLVEVGAGGVALRPLPLVRGRAPRSEMEVAVSQSLSPGISLASGQETAGSVSLGQSLTLTESRGVRRFSVVGVVADSGPGAPFTKDAVYVTAAAAQGLFRDGLAIEDIAVRLRPGATRSALTSVLPRALHENFTVSNPRADLTGDPIAELQPLLDAITALSLLLGVVLISATFSSIVVERRREIGLVRLAGASRSLIFRSFAREAAAVSALGGALGVGIGYLVAWVLVSSSNPAGQSPPATVVFEGSWTVAAFLLVLVLGMVAALLPAFEASTVAALDAVRPLVRRRRQRARAAIPMTVVAAAAAGLAFHMGGTGGVVAGAVLADAAVILGMWLAGPILVAGIGAVIGAALQAPVAAVAARGSAHPGRTALALGSLFVTISTAAGLAGLSASALQSGDLWVKTLFVGNYLVVSPNAQGDAIERDVIRATGSGAGAPRLGEVAPVRFLTARIGHVAVALAATSPRAYQASGALTLVAGNRSSALAGVQAGRSVIVPLQLAQETGMVKGERVRVVTSDGAATFTVAGIASHTLPGPSGAESILISQTTAERDFGSQAAGFNVLQMEVHGKGAARAVNLAGFRYGLESETVASVEAGVNEAIQHDIAAIGALALVGVVIAILAAINTVILETRESSRDLALLRVVGLSRAAVFRCVMGEAVAIAIVGCGLGLAGGVGLVWPEVSAASTPGLPLPFAVSAASLLVLGLATLVALLLAATIPARQLGRIDPVAALAVE